MKARPLLMSAPMVRALLDGRKTQTRRVVKGEALNWLGVKFDPACIAHPDNRLCPYGVPGDLLWVRETFKVVPETAYRMSEGVQQTVNPSDRYYAAIYAAGWDRSIPKWKPSLFMPRWASRLTLELIEVRVERLREIGEADALAEGIEGDGHGAWKCYAGARSQTHWADPRESYRTLWTAINGPGSWTENPWIWALTFNVHKANVDTILGASA